MEWKAIHFFIHDNTFHNKFLVEYLKPVVESLEKENLLERYFYIVYWQGGNHIRFRYRSPEPEKVEKQVSAAYEKFLLVYETGYVLDEDTYYEMNRNNKENVEDITIVPDKTRREYAYEPEYDRYGGPESMGYCENIFALSSKYTLQIRQQAGSSLMKRIIGSLDLFTLAIKGVHDKKRFLTLYRRYWSDFAPDNGRTLFSVKELAEKYKERYRKLMTGKASFYEDWEKGFTEEMNKACNCQTAYKDVDTAYNMILASQIHMTNNRLGLIPQLEAQLAEILYTCEVG